VLAEKVVGKVAVQHYYHEELPKAIDFGNQQQISVAFHTIGVSQSAFQKIRKPRGRSKPCRRPPPVGFAM
jgi:hypothetical protein